MTRLEEIEAELDRLYASDRTRESLDRILELEQEAVELLRRPREKARATLPGEGKELLEQLQETLPKETK